MSAKVVVIKGQVTFAPDERRAELVTRAIAQVKAALAGLTCDFEVIFLESREALDMLLPEQYRPSPPWLAGSAAGRTVRLLDEAVFDTESSHTKEEFFPILVHEITHVFVMENFAFVPTWLNEGLACVTAGQISGPKEKCDIRHLHSDVSVKNDAEYSGCQRFVSFLIGKFGKAKLFDFLACLERNEARQSCAGKFEKVYGVPFDDVFEEWLAL